MESNPLQDMAPHNSRLPADANTYGAWVPYDGSREEMYAALEMQQGRLLEILKQLQGNLISAEFVVKPPQHQHTEHEGFVAWKMWYTTEKRNE